MSDDDDPPAEDRTLQRIADLLLEQGRLFPRPHAPRGRERRGQDRRALGYATRRQEDAERHGQVRALLNSLLRQLPEETLWLLIDGLWLGQATDAELAALGHAFVDSKPAAADKGLRRRGRLPADGILPRVPLGIGQAHSGNDVVLGATWSFLTGAMKVFKRYRDQHRSPKNRNRRGRPISFEHRAACLALAIGQRVDRAGLFDEFFDDACELGPSEMAARLLHREFERRLVAYRDQMRESAAKRLSPENRAFCLEQVAKAKEQLARFPSWQTFYDRLRKS